MDKAGFRAVYLRRRRELPQEVRDEAAQRAAERLRRSAHFIAQDVPEVVGLYVAVQGEISTRPIYDWLLSIGRKVAFPRVDGDYCVYSICEWGRLARGKFNLPEPPTDAPTVDPGWVFVPGIAFDLHGARVGFGHGYFDRTLSKLRSTRIGLGYTFQVVDSIPQEPWDQRLDYILTDETFIIPAKGPESD